MSEKRSPENAKTKKVPRIITSWFSHSRIKILRSKCINVYSKKGVTLEFTANVANREITMLLVGKSSMVYHPQTGHSPQPR
jgi:hypothetical protein